MCVLFDSIRCEFLFPVLNTIYQYHSQQPVSRTNGNRIMEHITLNKRYPLSSFLRGGSLSRPNIGEITTLQYVFKPSSVDPNQKGSLSISNTHEALIALPTIDTEIEKESFKGIATKPSNEFILSFDGGYFQLDRVVSAVTNIRHSRNESAFSTKDVAIGNSRKFHEQSLLLRAGPRAAKRKRTTKPDAAKSSIKEPAAKSSADGSQCVVEAIPTTEPVQL